MRKIIVILGLFILACNTPQVKDCNTAYHIRIWDSHSSKAYTGCYNITNDSLSMKFIGGLEGETNKIIFNKALSNIEQQQICNYLNSFNIDTLRSEYINTSAEDGDQKTIEFTIGSKNKTIQVSNIYLKFLDGLFDVINKAIKNEDEKIHYAKPFN